MFEKLEAKGIVFLVMLLIQIVGGIALVLWGHHLGSTADMAKVAKCTLQNSALAEAIKTDAATIVGLKQANAATASAAEVNETQLKASVADLTNKLAQSQANSNRRQKNLQSAVDHDKTSSQWANTPVPPAILDILRQ